MKALVYRRSIPRYLLLKLLGPRMPSLYSSGAAPLSYCDTPEPQLPNKSWVRIAPKLAGICGSDLATVCAKNSPYLAPVTSLPFVLGHELVGRITETGSVVSDLTVGDRVVLHPALGCKVRGIDPPCDACEQHRDALCRNFTRGAISAGIQTGFCRDTGGAFGASLVAHQSQVYSVPEALSDEVAVLCEPFACALHGALRAQVGEHETALVIGCGTIGLLTIAALRATGCKARIVAIARFDHQKEHAKNLGADEILPTSRDLPHRYSMLAKTLGAEVLKPELGKPFVLGGADVTYDCIGSAQTIDDGVRFTRSGGTFVLVGMPGMPKGIDWTPLWFQEVTLKASYAYGPESVDGGTHDTFDVALDLLRDWGPRLAPLVGTPFELKDYRHALRSALATEQNVKTVFRVNENA